MSMKFTPNKNFSSIGNELRANAKSASQRILNKFHDELMAYCMSQSILGFFHLDVDAIFCEDIDIGQEVLLSNFDKLQIFAQQNGISLELKTNEVNGSKYFRYSW